MYGDSLRKKREFLLLPRKEKMNEYSQTEPVFTGVWIPKEVLLDESLKPADKILYAEIASFGDRGCWKQNAELAEIIGVGKMTFIACCKRLEVGGYITQKRLVGRVLRTTTLSFAGKKNASKNTKPAKKQSPKIGLESPKIIPQSPKNGPQSPKNGLSIKEYTKNTQSNTHSICSSPNGDLHKPIENVGKCVVKKSGLNVKIAAVFDHWEKVMGVKMKSSKLNGIACKRLIEFCGGDEEQVCRVIDAIPVMVREEGEYAVRISDFVDLEKKWNKMMDWGRRKAIKVQAEKEEEEKPIEW